jgi:hypothetical protein
MKIYPLLFLLFAAGLLGVTLTLKKVKIILPYSLLIVIMVGGFFLTVVSVLPFVNNFKSAKPFCERISKTVKPENTMIMFRYKPESFNYFLKRVPIPVIRDYPELQNILNAAEKVYCIIQQKYYEMAPKEIKDTITILDESQIGHRKYYLIVNKAKK